MRVALTGGRGFLGRHLAAALPPGSRVAFLEGDVRARDTFGAAAGCDVLYHFAARSNVPESRRDPRGTWDVNVNGTLELLEWARGADCRARIVLVSSAQVYGTPRSNPVDEGQPLAPRAPYGASKAAMEALGLAYHESYGLDVAIARPFNVYGPGQAAGFLVSDLFGQLARGPSLTLGDPEPVRDFVHVADAARFLALLGSKPSLGARILNLGTGQGHSIRSVAEAAVRACGLDAVPRFLESRRRPWETPALVADIRAAGRELGWRPELGLEEGLRRTWQAWPRAQAATPNS